MSTKLPINLTDLLRQRTVEGERIEYKAGWNPDPIIRTVCAFANDFENLGGGYVVIGQGCDANGQPVFPPAGLTENQLDKIQRELLAHCQLIQPPYFPVLSIEEVEGDTEQELLSLAAKVPFDDRYNQSASIDDLSKPLMQAFLQEVGSTLAEDAPSLSLEALARQMNVAGGPTESPWHKNVGLLFFNETPERFFPAVQIDVVWFPEGAGGDRAEATRVWNFPYAAIEEALVNAVYHRSYEEREPIEVHISHEELVILSFHGPDRSIRLEDFAAGRAVSRRYRNRRIGEFLKELDLTEGRSTGIPKILKQMAANGSPCSPRSHRGSRTPAARHGRRDVPTANPGCAWSKKRGALPNCVPKTGIDRKNDREDPAGCAPKQQAALPFDSAWTRLG